MRAVITNISGKIVKGPATGRHLSRLQIQATGPLWPHPVTISGTDLYIQLEKAKLNFPAERLPIYDGVIAEVVPSESTDCVRLRVRLDYPVPPSVAHLDGIPFCVNIDFDRSKAFEALADRVIALDPGHGGSDMGERGPINLLEKDVCLECARYLVEALKERGARPFLTRDRDISLPVSKRLQTARSGGAEAVVSLHTHSDTNPYARGLGVRWFDPASEGLADSIYRQMNAQFHLKMGLPVRGNMRGSEHREYAAARNLVIVEIASISNLVDEGWLRSITYMERVASSIANGLRDFFRRQAGEPHAEELEGRQAGRERHIALGPKE